MGISYNKDTRFLFVGDVVTDAGRASDAEGIGQGYVRMIRDYLRAKHPPLAPVVLNRATAGARITELASAWQQQVIAERPDLVSVLIGVSEPGQSSIPAGGASGAIPAASLDQFRTVYRHIVAQTSERLPRCRIVLCEPTAVWSSASVEADENLRPYVSFLTELAREFDAAAFVPLHSAFVYARRSRPDIRWVAGDGQLTSSGHMLVAYTWMESLEIVRRQAS